MYARGNRKIKPSYLDQKNKKKRGKMIFDNSKMM